MISRENLQDLYPLAPMQEGMLFDTLMSPDSLAYREQAAYRVRGALDVARLEACWREIVRRHDALRTVFVHEKVARPLQMVLKAVPVRIDVVDLGMLEAGAREARAAALRREERARAFDLAREPPSRVRVLALGPASHEIVWTFHHIILDGWSVARLMAELLQLYGEEGAPGAATLSQPTPYARYIQWLEARDGARDRGYWRERLAGFAGPTSIPSSRPGPAGEAYEAAQYERLFTVDETAAFEAFARARQVTPGAALQALWAILLSRYQAPSREAAQRADVAFGAVVSGRPPAIPGVESMIGLFTNTVALRVAVDADEPLGELLARVQSDALEAQEHAYVPLAQAQPAPGAIDHAVAYENFPRGGVAAGPAHARPGFEVDAVAAVAQTPYDLNVAFVPGERLAVHFLFNAARYSAAQLERLGAQLGALMAAAIASPDAPVGGLDLLPAGERGRIEGFALTRRGRAGPVTLQEAILARVRESPGAVAIVDGDTVLTYGDLEARSRALAAALARHPRFVPGARVAVVLERSAGLPIAWLAIMRAGGVYLPLDTAFPDERVGFIVRDSEAALVLTTAARRASIEALAGDAAVVEVPEAGEGEGPFTDAAPAECAYVIYTSGSTGVPKGVALGHAGVLNLMAHLRELHPTAAGDRVALFASPAFDASIWEMGQALCHGAALVVVDRDTAADPAHFGALMRRHRCTVAILPPSYARLLDPDDLASLRLLATGGEAAHPDTATRLSRRVRYANLYGPTEASIQATTYEVLPGERFGRSVPIGRPIPNVEALVLDRQDRPVPIGAPGELCLGGVCVGIGYLNRPELDRARFTPHPWKPAERVYRTGDIVRWLDDGNLEFLGRADDQVKLRGHRIELGEIQARLLALPGVRQGAVVVEGDGEGLDRLAAYVVLEPPVSGEDLRIALRRALPEYMVPSRFVTLDALPLTPQGKLDRAALPRETPEVLRASAPADALQAELARIFEAVLGAREVGPDSSFFDLGGHSLTAVRLVSRVRKELGYALEVRELFEHPTLEALAACLRGRERARAEAIPRLPAAADYAVSHAQKRLWLLHAQGAGAGYNIAGAFRVEGPLDGAALEQAARALVARHEVLRTSFHQVDGEPRQRVREPDDSAWVECVDVSSREDPRAAALALFAEAQSRVFDLEAGRPLRLLLVREAPRRHLLGVVLHHIVADEWSIDVATRELGVLYAAALEGRDAQLPPLSVQHRDVAAWLGAMPQEAHAAYWRAQLAAPLPVLELPADRPRPRERSFRGAVHRFALDPTSHRALASIARASHATLFMALTAAVKVLLARYTGQQDIVVGHPAAGREHPQLEDQLGFFVNTIALRDRVAPQQSFRELVGAVRRTVLDGLAHQAYPFDRLVEELGIARDASRQPLFDVMVAYDRAAAAGLRLEGAEAEPVACDSGTSKFDLLFAFTETPSALHGAIEYATDLFEPATIARLEGHLATLLAAIAAAPDAPIAELALLTAAEAAALEADAEPVCPAAGDSVVARFARAAAADPEALAAVCGEARVGYAELDRRASAVARELLDAGAGGDIAVGLLVERSVDMLVGMLGILKAGAGYLPLDPAAPMPRLRSMTGDARVFAVVTQRALVGTAQALGARAIVIEDAIDVPPADRLPAVQGSDLAYVLFTSGSTGRPNGVMVEHRNVMALLDAFDAVAPRRGRVVATTLCPFGFDVSVWEIFSALACGGTVHVLTSEVAADARKLVAYFCAHGITNAYLPPALVDEVGAELARAGGAALERLLVGVEPIAQGSLERLCEAVPGLAVVNGYGPTEATVCATFHRHERGGDPAARVPIGRAARGYEVHLLDAAMQPVPVGVPGEIFVGGAGLARGYAGNAPLTAQRFVPHPFARGAGKRLYRTGDLARRRADGALEFLGRADHQLKLRGFRVEPGEVEAALRQHALVREAAVLPRQGPRGLQLVAYVAADAIEAAELRAFARSRLPDYMVPAAFVVLPALPRNANGKVDREALSRIEPAPAAAGSDTAPANATEATLLRLWSEVLGVAGVGREDGFFDLGGHSLLATRLLGRIREACGVELPLAELFASPTVRATAQRIDARRAEQRPAPPRIVRAARSAPLPLSFEQQRLWFLEQLEPGPAYNVPIALALEGELDPGRVERALNAVIARHEALRTRFVAIDGRPVQEVLAERPIVLGRRDLSHAGTAVAEHEALRQAAALAARPFDLAADALLRAELLRLAPRHHVLLLVIHHIVVDGWSAGVLMQELAAAYSGESLPALEIQYADFAAWQRAEAQEERLAAQVDYWKRRLDGLPPLLELPTDRPRIARGERRAGIERFGLDAAIASRVRECARRLEATPFMVLLAAFQALLVRLTGQRDIAVGTPIAHRTAPQVEPLIGFFANTVVLRASFEGAPGFDEVVRRVREAALDAYAHQDAPFERVVDAVQPERSLAHTPLFQVLFVLQNAPLAPVRVPGLAIRALEQPATTAKFDLTVVAEERDGAIACALEYNADLFDAASARALAARWRTLLDAALAAPGTAVERLPLLAAAERRALLDAARANAASASPGTVTALVAAQVARTPAAIAIEEGDATLTYAALEARSNRLAHHLRALGAGPGSAVGLCVPRSADLLVALLAVAKSGAAVVPLDLSYPRARLEFMLREAAVTLLVQRDAPAFDVATVDLERDRALIEAQPETDPGVAIAADDLLYILFTSGSTGTPKGVELPHRVIANLVGWGLAGGEFAAPARTLQFTPVSFDVSFQEVFGCWASGGAVVAIDEDRRRDSALLLEFLAEARIERLFLPFVALQGLAEAASDVPADRLPRALRQVVTAGEQLRSTSALTELFSRLPGCELHNHYGPTETHVITAHRLRGAPADWPALPPIGHPIAGARLYVLDAHLQPVPPGVAGELYAGGVAVACGYVNRPELTGERFIADPFEGAGVLYRTGDRVRLTRDGDYEFIGRADGQLKVRGFRVEPAEIEAALTRRADVAQAAVIADDCQRLVAYVVPAAGCTVEADAIRAALAQSLPAHMVPAALVPLEALPLTPSGKLDRARLPRPAFAEAAARSTPPRTATEHALAAIWCEVLGIERAGIHESFFELGGHSLLATRVISRIRTRLGASLTLKRLFESPTIAALAPAVEAAAAGREAPIDRVPRDRPLACSAAQERLWYAASLDASGAGYNMAGALRLKGTLDVAALQAALGEIVRRHEILRTRLVERDGRLLQEIDAAAPLRFDRLDAAPGGVRETMARLAAHRFDLARELPVRFALIRCAPDDHRLVMVLHHVAADGWSLGVLAREAKALYAAHARGAASPLAGLEIQYGDFAAWQRERLAGERGQAHRDYWKRQLAGAPPWIEWPLAHRRPQAPSFRGAIESFAIDASLAARLREAARARGTTLNTLLFAAYAVLLHRLSGEDDLVIATPAANRGHPQAEPLIGLFVNLLPIRVRFGARPTFDALARELHATLIEALAREEWPFEKIVEDLAPQRSLALQAPYAQAVFALQNWPRAPLELPGLTIEEEPLEATSAKGDLALSMEEAPEGLRGSLEYALDLFDAGMARQMVQAYRDLVVALVDSPQAPVLEERRPAASAHSDDFSFEEG